MGHDDPPIQSLDYQCFQPAERLNRAPMASLLIGFAGSIVDLLLRLGVFTNDAGYAAPTLIAVGIVLAASVMGLRYGVRGLRAKKNRILIAQAGIILSLASLVVFFWMAVYFFTHLHS